jgi:hypothetical protein
MLFKEIITVYFLRITYEIRKGGQKYPTYNKKEGRKDNWSGYILCRNCLLKHVIEGKIEKQKWREDEEGDVSSYCHLSTVVCIHHAAC